jgi:O-antigen ligase
VRSTLSTLALADRRPSAVRLTKWHVLAVAAALLVAAAATWKPTVAVGMVLALGILLAVVRRTGSILVVLVVTTFVEMIRIGDLRITRVVAPVALVVILLAATRKGTRIRVDPPLLWALAYSTWALASGLWTQNLGGTIFLLSSLAISLIYMFAFALLLTRRDLDRVLVALAIASLLVGVSSILAFTGHHWLGLGKSELQGGRVQGATGDPSFFAAFQLIVLPLVLVIASHSRGWKRYALFLAALINVGSVLSTVSRGGVLQLVALFALLVLWPPRSLFGSVQRKAMILLVVALGGAAFFVRYKHDIQPRLATVFAQGKGGPNDTGSGRLIIWPAAWDAFRNHPFTGIGYGAFLPQSLDRMFDTHGTDFGNFQPIPQEPHNTFLGALTELGVPGLIFLVGLLVSTGVALRRIAVHARAAGDFFLRRVSNALLVGLIAWETARPLWIVIGFSLALPKLIQAPAEDAASAMLPRRRRAPLGPKPSPTPALDPGAS